MTITLAYKRVWASPRYTSPSWRWRGLIFFRGDGSISSDKWWNWVAGTESAALEAGTGSAMRAVAGTSWGSTSNHNQIQIISSLKSNYKMNFLDIKIAKMQAIILTLNIHFLVLDQYAKTICFIWPWTYLLLHSPYAVHMLHRNFILFEVFQLDTLICKNVMWGYVVFFRNFWADKWMTMMDYQWRRDDKSITLTELATTTSVVLAGVSFSSQRVRSSFLLRL